ncbi:MAG: hypothetical protein A2Z14_00805 [Chloroflexi bacterium RBG_16_48_8]|nr:MAG: hypothetical protein A2Z14_00805 [Chloroflexi bacterium RBG_16_48_8]
MLWFDSNQQQDVSARIKKASTYYRSKYGRKPDLCYVHPSTLCGEIPKEVDGLKVLMSQTVLPNHFWLGIEKAEASKVHSKVAA